MHVVVHIFVRKLSNFPGRVYTHYTFMRAVSLNFETFGDLESGIKAHTFFSPDIIFIRRNTNAAINQVNFNERFQYMNMLNSTQTQTRSGGSLYLCAYYTSNERNAPLQTGHKFIFSKTNYTVN
jgi:hypothetical protein